MAKRRRVDPKDNPHGHPIPDYWDDLTDDEKRFLLDAPVVDIVPHGGTGVVVSRARRAPAKRKPTGVAWCRRSPRRSPADQRSPVDRSARLGMTRTSIGRSVPRRRRCTTRRTGTTRKSIRGWTKASRTSRLPEPPRSRSSGLRRGRVVPTTARVAFRVHWARCPGTTFLVPPRRRAGELAEHLGRAWVRFHRETALRRPAPIGAIGTCAARIGWSVRLRLGHSLAEGRGPAASSLVLPDEGAAATVE